MRDHAEEKIRAQIEILDWLAEKKPAKIDDPAAYLVASDPKRLRRPQRLCIQGPSGSGDEEAQQAKERQDAEERRRKQQKEAGERIKQQRDAAYWESLTPEQQARLDANALAQADPESLALEELRRTVAETDRPAHPRNAYIRSMLDHAEQTTNAE